MTIDPLHLRRVLADAISQQPALLHPAEQQLAQWETLPFFHAMLIDILRDTSLSKEIQWIAVIYIKNGIDRYWRKSAPNAIKEEEKQYIRERIVERWDESWLPLATQIAVLISKMARIDVPDQWPNLLPLLMKLCHDSSNILVQHRVLMTLHYVIKVLCAKMLPASKRVLQQMAPSLFENVIQVFIHHFEQFKLSSTEPEAIERLQCALMACKSLRRLFVYGLKEQHLQEPFASFPLYLLQNMKYCLSRLQETSPSESLSVLLNKLILLVGKTCLDLQDMAPYTIILSTGFMQCLSFYFEKILSFERGVHEGLVLQALILLRNTVRNTAYTVECADENMKSTVEQCKIVIDNELLKKENILQLVQALLTRFLVLTQHDLNLWQSDAESVAMEEESDSWLYNLRLCSEALFVDFMTEHGSLLAPELMKWIEAVLALPMDSMSHLLEKEAGYCVFALSATSLYDYVDFGHLLATHFVKESIVTCPCHFIIRRRIAELIGAWVEVKLPISYRHDAIALLIHFTSSSQHLVVRLVAARQLRHCIDNWEFHSDQLSDQLEICVTSLLRLMQDVETFESRLLVMQVLILVVERMQVEILPHLKALLLPLPDLWMAAEDQNLFRSSILTLLTRMIQVLPEDDEATVTYLQPLIGQIVQHSLDPQQQSLYIYLVEDALILWHAALCHAVTCSKAMIDLIPRLMSLLDASSENLKGLLSILESYLMMTPWSEWRSYQSQVIQLFSQSLPDLIPSGVAAMVRCLDIWMQIFPFSLEEWYPVFQFMLHTVLSNAPDATVTVLYLSLLGRLLLVRKDIFLSLIKQEGTDNEMNLFSVWLNRFENILNPQQRQLTLFAFCEWIAVSEAVRYEWPSLVTIFVDILSEVTSTSNDGLMYWRAEELETLDEGWNDDPDLASPDAKRHQQLLARDPIHQTTFKQRFISLLHDLQSSNSVTFDQMMNSLDPNVLHHLKTLLAE